jgi:two-component system response regulator NreC
MRVLVADDHSIVRQGLGQLLLSQSDVDVVGTAKDGEEALEKAKLLRPDVTLLDISMPHLNGIETARLIKEALPDTQIVILAMYDKEAFVHEAFASGAMGYVLKAGPSSEVIEAVRAAHRGEYFLSPKIRAEVIHTYMESGKEIPSPVGYDLLSDREQQVFRLVVEGNITSRIAGILHVSPKTVEKHRTNIGKKLGIHDLVGLVKYAIRTGIIDPDLWKN